MTPKITAVVAPEYDGYSMTVRWNHTNPATDGVLNSTMYNYKVEYRLKNDDNELQWQTSRTLLLNELTLRSMLVPFHDYQFRVLARPVMNGYWSDASDIVVGRTKATEPTAKLNPKYSIISYNGHTVKIRFFWLPYQQNNAPNNRFRIRVKTRNCAQNHQNQRIRTILDDVIVDPRKTSHEIQLEVDTIPCINAEFVVENDKGATSPEVIAMDLFKGTCLTLKGDIPNSNFNFS